MSIVKPKVFWSLVFTTKTIVVTAGGGDRTWSLPGQTALSAALFAASAQESLRATHASLSAATVTVDNNGIFTFANGTAILIKWATATSGAPNLFGFAATNTASATTLTGAFQHANGWYSPVAVVDDSLPVRDRMMDVVTRTMIGTTKYFSENELIERFLIFKFVPPEYTYQAFESGANINRAIERWWDAGRSRFRYWPDAATEGTSFDYTLDADTIKKFQPKRQFTKKGLYEINMGCFGYV